MGVNDAAEMLEVAKEQAILDEHTIASLRHGLESALQLTAAQNRRLDAIRTLCASSAITLQDAEDAPYEVVEVWRVQQILDAPDPATETVSA
jgi:ABC-type lipopolysaccharide export system ATPase subunit